MNTSKTSPTPLTFVVLAAGRESTQAIQTALSAQPHARVVASSDSPEAVYTETLRWHPSAVILTLGGNPRVAWELSRRIHAASPDTLIISAAPHATPEMILESLRAGACEFLRLPIIAEEFYTVLERVQLFSANQAPRKAGCVIAVHSGKGGSGTSFIAANLAASLEAPAVLVDLDLRSGSQDVFFGVSPKYSMHDLIINRVRLDDELLTTFLTPLSPTLQLLAAPLNVEAAEEVRPEDIDDFVQLLRERYDYVVLDLPHNLNATSIAALNQASEIVLVTTLDLLAARATQRSLRLFNRLGYIQQKIKVVANRYAKNSSLTLDQVEQFLGSKIAGCISNDYPSALASINEGQPLVQRVPMSPLTAEIRQLAQLCGIPLTEKEPAPRQGLLASFLRRSKATPAMNAAALPDEA